MLRRTFLAASAATLAFPAFAGDTLDYTDGLIKQALADGKTVFVDYAAHWCSTCASQERTIAKLRKENPAYDEQITFVRVDWDAYGSKPVSKDRKIPRRSTLIVLKGEEELGRIVAGTREADIKSLLDTALTAASS